MNKQRQPVEAFPWHIWEQHIGNHRAHSAEGRPGRMISGRLLPGCDLLLGIVELAKKHEVRSAWVNGFGSLAKARFSPGIRLSEAHPDKVVRCATIDLPGPIEMWSGMARLGIPDHGEPAIHFHGVVTAGDGRLVGGHFFPGDSPVYATFEVHIQEILGVEFRLEMDAAVKLPLIEPKTNI